jgi:hypothetical protein
MMMIVEVVGWEGRRKEAERRETEHFESWAQLIREKRDTVDPRSSLGRRVGAVSYAQ